MLTPVQWLPTLGAARAQIDLAAEFEALGHEVEVFDYRAAFGDGSARRRDVLLPDRFQRRARAFVREHGKRFDVVDALQGALPFSKAELRFDGLLVARSPSLYAFYDEYARFERTRWPERAQGTRLGRALVRRERRRWVRAARRHFDASDLIVLPNPDELAFVRDSLGLGDRAVMFPNTLTAAHANALAAAACSADDRLARCEVSFIGSWTLRKGVADWSAIMAETRRLVPETRFAFLGTWLPREAVLRDLGLGSDPERILVVPRFQPDELPGLVAGATVGALPSYVEAFGIGVAEQLAAGLPAVAYDVPGPRFLLDAEMLAPRGDARRFAELLAGVLRLSPASYGAASERARRRAAAFDARTIAQMTLDAYEAARPT